MGPLRRCACVWVALALAACANEGPLSPAVSSTPSPVAPAVPSGASSRPAPAPPSRAWPELPRSAAAADALIRGRARRTLPPDRLGSLDARGLLAAIIRAQERGRLLAGWSTIAAALHALAAGASEAAPTYYLFGTYHDAGGQVAAFRRLVGPGGLGDLSPTPLEVVAEQLDADGHWRGAPAALQRGDDTLLGAYLRDGSPRAYAALLAQQRALDYTAWKYRYLHEVLGLAVDARATQRRLHPCDMPRALQARARAAVGEQPLLRLRELHCLFALTERLRRAGAGAEAPRRVAMLWGQDHVGPRGVQRFLPAKARAVAIYLFGHRAGPLGLEAALARSLALTHPVLVPLDDHPAPRPVPYRQLALLLPGPRLAAHWNQTRDPGSLDTKTRSRLRLSSEQAGTLVLPGRKLQLVARREAWIAVPEPLTFLVHSAGIWLLGSLALALEGQLELELDARHRSVEALLRTP